MFLIDWNNPRLELYRGYGSRLALRFPPWSKPDAMRVTSTFYVSALIRRVTNAGGMAVVQRHGAEEAGAVFVIIDRLDGTVDLYSPAPQSVFAGREDLPADRLFTLIAERAAESDVAARLAKETRFDPDLWVVAIEDREGRPWVEVAKG